MMRKTPQFAIFGTRIICVFYSILSKKWFHHCRTVFHVTDDFSENILEKRLDGGRRFGLKLLIIYFTIHIRNLNYDNDNNARCGDISGSPFASVCLDPSGVIMITMLLHDTY